MCPLEIDRLIQAIESNQFELPTMPDWALKIQQMLDDINVSASQLVAAISSDPVFAVQIVKLANSAAYCDKPRVDTLAAAIPRLGYRMLRNLILTVTMQRMANAGNPHIRKRLLDFAEHSREVAAISYVLAKNQKHLNPDEAMLAGLVHDIGTIPLCLHMDKLAAVFDEDACEAVLARYRAPVGEKLLQAWAFPPELAAVAVGHEALRRDVDARQADYVDIVAVANLLGQPNAKFVEWDNVTALERLWISPQVCRDFATHFGSEVRSARTLLFQG